MDKNMRDFCGQPLAALSVIQALSSSRFDEVVFSSDSPDYEEQVIRAVEVLGIDDSRLSFHRRNAHQSGERSKIFDVLREIYGLTEGQRATENLVTLMLPTAPLRSRKTLEGVVDLALTQGRDVFTSCRYDFHVSFAFEIAASGEWKKLHLASPMATGNTRSQDQGDYWHPHGGAVAIWTHKLTKNRNSIYSGALPFPTSRVESFDIDTVEDLELTRSVGEALKRDFPFWAVDHG